MTDAVRGFPVEEFADRVRSAQALMAKSDLSALLLTTEPEVRYFTGFLTRFWESPTRPWFVVLPSSGDPIAVIPSIGAHLMSRTWVTDIRTWQAPDYSDDGVGLLAETLLEVTPQDGSIGIAHHIESHVRMPLSSLAALKAAIGPKKLSGDHGITRRLRLVKSEREVTKIRQSAEIANRAFDRVNEVAGQGDPLASVFRKFQSLCLDEGADWVPYLAGAAGPGGYGDVISPATDVPLASGDVLMLDTGLVWDGYFCDFDRNFSLGPPTAEVARAHAHLVAATDAAMNIAKSGAVMSDLFHAMHEVIGADCIDGRFGHGLGMQLTEWPSILPDDHTSLEPGMVLTLEPAVQVGRGRLMVHEENIVIRQSGAEFLSCRQDAAIRVLQ